MLQAYRQHAAERAALGIPPLPLDAQQVADTVVQLRARYYSIASIPADGSLELLVRQGHRPDGSLGLAAGWLTRHAAPGKTIALRLRSNPNFHAPDDDVPLILIGNGTGLAALRALLAKIGKQ